jgi:hypothetical protein
MTAPESSEARAIAVEGLRDVLLDAEAVGLTPFQARMAAILAVQHLLADPAPTAADGLREAVEALCDAAEYVVLAVDDPGCPPVKAVAEIDLRAALTATAPPVDPYCPEHGTLPTTYDECSCRARALTAATAEPAGGEER